MDWEVHLNLSLLCWTELCSSQGNLGQVHPHLSNLVSIRASWIFFPRLQNRYEVFQMKKSNCGFLTMTNKTSMHAQIRTWSMNQSLVRLRMLFTLATTECASTYTANGLGMILRTPKTLSMRSFRRFIHQKLRKLKRKYFLLRKQSPATKDASNQFQPFQFVGFQECERLLPSSNRGLLVYDVPSTDNQTSAMMLEAFRRSFTPMDLSNESNGTKIFWIELLWRGQIPLDERDHGGFHLPRRLKQTLNNRQFTVTVDTDFPVRFRIDTLYLKWLWVLFSLYQGVITCCASTTGENRRDRSWINLEITRLMIELHHQGYAHSVEVWQGGKLVGGLYGVSLGGYFTIESQFSLVKDASKV